MLAWSDQEAEPRHPRSVSRQGLAAMEQPVVEKETHGISPKAMVPPWPSLESPDAAPASSEWAAHRLIQTLPGTPSRLCLASGAHPCLQL